MICDNSDKIEDIQVHSGLRKFGPQHSDRAPGVRDGAPWPRDQPASAVHLQPAAQDRSDQVALVKTKCVGIAENCEKGKFKQKKTLGGEMRRLQTKALLNKVLLGSRSYFQRETHIYVDL